MFKCFSQMFPNEKDIPELRLYSCSGVGQRSRIHVVVISQWFVPGFLRDKFQQHEDPRSAPAAVNRSGVAEWSRATALNNTADGVMLLSSCGLKSDGNGGYKEKIVKLKVVDTGMEGKEDEYGNPLDSTIAKGEVDLAENLGKPVEIMLTNEVKLRMQAQINHVASAAANDNDDNDDDGYAGASAEAR